MDYKVAGVCVFSIIVLLICAFAIRGFGKMVVKSILNVTIGMAVLFVLHMFGQYFGYKIAFNVINAVIIGFLGIPGIILTIALQHIL